MMAMIANISALTMAAINLATTLCKLPKLANSAAAKVAYKSSMFLLASVAFHLAMLVMWATDVIATPKSQKAANSLLAKIVKIGVLVKVMSTVVVAHAAAIEVREIHIHMVRRESNLSIYKPKRSTVST